VRGTEYVNLFGRFTGFVTGTALGLVASLILVYSERISQAFRVRKPGWLRLYSRTINRIYTHRWWVHSISALGLAVGGGMIARESAVVAGATVFYASMLFVQTLRDRPAAKIESIRAKNPPEMNPPINVSFQLKNTGEAEIERGVAMVRIRDPVEQQKTEWHREEGLEAIQGDIISSSILLSGPDWATDGDMLLEFIFEEPRMRGLVYTFIPLSEIETVSRQDSGNRRSGE